MKRALWISTVALAILSSSVAALAQSKPNATKAEPAKQSAPSKTVYDFDDDIVEGTLQSSDAGPIFGDIRSPQTSLIEIRKDFLPEMRKSVEDM
jgi:hypothetical protein